MIVRYSIPDSADGKGPDAPIDLYANSIKMKTLSSIYRGFYGGYPININRGGWRPHHFYDETKRMFDKSHPAGTKVKLEVSSTAHLPSITIDLADFDSIGPTIKRPAGSLSVIDYHTDHELYRCFSKDCWRRKSTKEGGSHSRRHLSTLSQGYRKQRSLGGCWSLVQCADQ